MNGQGALPELRHFSSFLGLRCNFAAFPKTKKMALQP
jgi:hypothetical protein